MSAKRRAATKPAKRAAPQLRRCSRCQQSKPVAEFPRNRARADGLALYCRPCKREADRATRRTPSPAGAQPEAWLSEQHPPTPPPGDARNPVDREGERHERARAPALAITDELVTSAGELIRETGCTRRAAARHLGVSENTFKSWLREGADVKVGADDPRARLLFAVESAEGDVELELTREYRRGARLDPQVAQRFLERRFSRGDEKWARTEHLTVTDGDASPMEVADARKLLSEKLAKLLAVPSVPAGSGGGAEGPGAGTRPAGERAAAPSAEAAEPGTAASTAG